MCKNAAALNGDRIDVDLNGTQFTRKFVKVVDFGRYEKSILAVSHISEFSLSRGQPVTHAANKRPKARR
jgi:hypothetical protein